MRGSISSSAFRYQPAPDRNEVLRKRIGELAHRHRYYGADLIYLKLRQEGLLVNHKRVDRLYAPERLQVRRCKRKKISAADRCPLDRLGAVDGRVVQCLTIVDDATHKAVGSSVERGNNGKTVTRILDRLALARGLPQTIGTDNGKEFCGKDILTWGYKRGMRLFLIQPGKPNQNAYVESFKGRFRDDCLNEHWFTSLAHAQVVIE